MLYNHRESDPYYRAKSESYQIIEKAQLWYCRSVENGGGDRSFRGLDYSKIGYPISEDGSSYVSNGVTYRFQNLERYTFDIQATLPDGTILSARNLAYNTHPKIIQ